MAELSIEPDRAEEPDLTAAARDVAARISALMSAS
jgi:hypothetical protein